MISRLSEQNLAKLAAVYSGLVFGIYWIPLRALEQAGFPGLWATAVFNLASVLIMIPIVVRHRHRLFPGRLRLHLIGFGTGLGYALYATAFVYTEVVNVIVLFYLMPIWGFLLARVFIADPITPARFWSMVVGFAGLWVILGEGASLPFPDNAGDWMALFAGFVWAAFALLILMDGKEEAAVYATGFVFWALVITVVSALLVSAHGDLPQADWPALVDVFPWMIPFAMVVIVPAAIATVYAPTKLNPGIVGILFMAEISVGTITAAIWADEPFGTRQLLGIGLITVAGILETAWVFLGRNRSAPDKK
jgi:drug/metabolite transporter (DMT)-like permease